MKILKSIWAILAGILLGAFLATATDGILEATGILPSYAEQQAHGLWVPWMLALVLTYRLLYNVLSGYVTAALAPDRPARHLLILSVIGFIAPLIGAYVMQGKGPLWYPVLLALLTPPTIWLGGRWRQSRIQRR